MTHKPLLRSLPPFPPQISSPAIYAVFSKLPTVGPVVEQPDGGLAYAAPPPQQYPPPRTYQQV